MVRWTARAVGFVLRFSGPGCLGSWVRFTVFPDRPPRHLGSFYDFPDRPPRRLGSFREFWIARARHSQVRSKDVRPVKRGLTIPFIQFVMSIGVAMGDWAQRGRGGNVRGWGTDLGEPLWQSTAPCYEDVAFLFIRMPQLFKNVNAIRLKPSDRLI